MYTRIYNFHNIVKLKIVSTRKQYIRFLDDEYKYIQRLKDSASDDIDILIYMDCPFPEKSNKDHWQFHTFRFKNLFPVKYLVHGIKQKKTTVYFQGDATIHFYSFIMCSFLLNEIIDPLLYLKFLQREHMILHSACVADGQKAFVFCASGGVGKTTLSLKLMKEGMTFMCDDKTILSLQGTVYAYPRTLRLYTYNLKELPPDSFPWKIKMVIYLKDVLRAIGAMILRTKIYLATRIHLVDILPEANIGKQFPLGKILLLEHIEESEFRIKANDYRDLKEDATAVEYFVNKIIETCGINETLKINFLSDSANFLQEVEKKERENIRTILQKTDSIAILDPHKIQIKDFLAYLSGSKN